MNTGLANWQEANQRYLTAVLAVVRDALDRYARRAADGAESGEPDPAAQAALEAAAAAMPSSSALDVLCHSFGLSPFERDVLLMCAGVELDSGFAVVCAAAQGDPTKTQPTFSLALEALPEAHWNALSPSSPLRHWRLIEVGSGGSLTQSPLRIDERVLHYLAGIQHLDDRLAGMIEPLRAETELVASHRALVERIVAIWSRADGDPVSPAVQLCGDEADSKRAIAAAACLELGMNAGVLLSAVIPNSAAELGGLIRLWQREVSLAGSALFLDCDDTDATDPARESAVARLIEDTRGPLIVAGRERRRARQRPLVTLEVSRPTTAEQRSLWVSTLAPNTSGLDGQLEPLVGQFNLSAAVIRSAGAQVTSHLSAENPESTAVSEDLGGLLWDACRAEARPRLDDLAQRVRLAATWDDLVLPQLQLQTLREIAVHLLHRLTVYETWGFAAKSSRGLGISALFSGTSGTGKTMAAEVLANELRLDLYRIDLSSVVSKYIGDTEKNLRRVFDAAEAGGAILLFDEADALFGKRSEVKDSHDRYANIEVSYLLQRMETYRGLAILTTNMKDALDSAFLRRIRFIVQFPFPDAAHRAEIWRRIFPRETPTAGLDVDKLARLNVPGGNIRNIALNAAFLAANEDEPVRMAHLLRAARSEYAKLEKPLSASEARGWVE